MSIRHNRQTTAACRQDTGVREAGAAQRWDNTRHVYHQSLWHVTVHVKGTAFQPFYHLNYCYYVAYSSLHWLVVPLANVGLHLVQFS